MITAYKILGKDAFDGFFRSLAEGREVYAPAQKSGKIVWAPARSAADVDWRLDNTDMSPKEFFFPQSECLMRFKNAGGEGGRVMVPVAPLATQRVLLNIRPCDAKAFRLLDRIFVQDDMTNDPYWRDKREKTILIGQGCVNPCPECFCTSTGCGPFHEEGLDILLTDLGDRLLVKPISGKGQAMVKDLPEAAPGDIDLAGKIMAASEAAVNTYPGFEPKKLAGRTVLDIYNLPLWSNLYETCLNCGTCTFVCPTCHCFDIQDEVRGEAGRRVRNWDTCMQKLFTEHASGHNPRGEKRDRVRQRFMHKFTYIPMRRDGELGCVGCGRCVRFCPTNIDVREVVRRMCEDAEAKSK
ncbi:4Fe-4S dicluster domain-containing protein [Desulfolutivibrio sp.]|uniref:4Fe-4S dicluster domain-containing protein n=1 Tax=Desulfolutivibrio sp. TaxID=2773296 RepID=UPI002F969B8D